MIQLYAGIWRRTGRKQIVIILLSLLVAALAAVPLDYQKRIVNGMSAGDSFDQLLILGIQMSAVIFLSLTLKWILGYQSGIVGEWVIRYLRSSRFEGWLQRPGAKEPEENKGILANVISSESEVIGKFVGGAFADPLLQFGTLFSVIAYIAYNKPTLGLIVFCMILPQAILVLVVQGKINALVRERVIILRGTIDSITHSLLRDVRDSVLQDFDKLFNARRRIFLWKLSVKFFLGIMNGAGLVTVLVYGGWLVTEGRSDVGSIVAATFGLARIQQPWRELITFFRELSVVSVQYELLRDLLQDDKHSPVAASG